MGSSSTDSGGSEPRGSAANSGICSSREARSLFSIGSILGSILIGSRRVWRTTSTLRTSSRSPRALRPAFHSRSALQRDHAAGGQRDGQAAPIRSMTRNQDTPVARVTATSDSASRNRVAPTAPKPETSNRATSWPSTPPACSGRVDVPAPKCRCARAALLTSSATMPIRRKGGSIASALPAVAAQQAPPDHRQDQRDQPGGNAEEHQQGAGHPGADRAAEVAHRGIAGIVRPTRVGRIVAAQAQGQVRDQRQQQQHGGFAQPSFEGVAIGNG